MIKSCANARQPRETIAIGFYKNKKAMNMNKDGEFQIRSLQKPLPQADLDKISRITLQYYPASYDVQSMLVEHIRKQDTHIQIAAKKDRILGFSVHSCHKEMTPFHDRKIPLFYQHLLYVDPLARHKNLGLELQIYGLRYQLGRFWLFRRFAVICLTSNPLILRAFSQYNEYYPRSNFTIPEEVHEFCHKLAPALGCMHVDSNLRAYGTNESILSGTDYTEQWRNFLRSGHVVYDQQVLNTVFKQKERKVIHTGVLLVAIGYAEPMHFIKRYFERRVRQLCVRAGQNPMDASVRVGTRCRGDRTVRYQDQASGIRQLTCFFTRKHIV